MRTTMMMRVSCMVVCSTNAEVMEFNKRQNNREASFDKDRRYK